MISRKFTVFLTLTALTFIGVATFQGSVHAARGAKGFALKNGKVKLDVPSNWEDVTDLFGVPLMLLGPEKGGGRPVITVVPTGIKDASFDVSEMKKTQSDYQEGRKAWLKKYEGTAVAFNDYQTENLPGASEAHSIGYRYRIADVEFAEKSYYIVCNKQFYHVKTILRGQHEKDYGSTVDHAVKSFSCAD